MQAFLLSRIDYERMTIPKEAEYFKLERMRDFLRRLGNPQDRLSILHIAGTKGKGSTAAMAASMLREAGRKTGLFTSPHLHQIEERIVADGRMIPSEEFERILSQMRPVIEEVDALDRERPLPIGGPTFFEIINAAALVWFAEQKLDSAVIEVGLGGRLDSTNVCNPKATVITSIGLDHMKQLGSTLEEIAVEKAGILKPGAPAVLGPTAEGPRAEIRRIAAERGAPLLEAGIDFEYSYRPPKGDAPFRSGTVDYVDHFGERPFVMRDLVLPMLGAHQAANAATAIAAVRLFQAEGRPISPKVISSNAIRTGLAKGGLPARLQIVQQEPAILVDAAHNEPSVHALIEAIAVELPRFRRRTVLLAVSREKAIDEMLSLLAPHFDRIVCTRFVENPRAQPPGELAEAARRAAERGGCKKTPLIEAYEEPEAAWRAIRGDLAPNDLLCITGSFFIAAEMLAMLKALPPL